MAMRSLKHACKSKYAPSCFKLAAMLIKEKKAAEARPYLEPACEYGLPAACHTLAVMYKKGDGLPGPDHEKFMHYAKLTKDLVQQTGQRLGVEVEGIR